MWRFETFLVLYSQEPRHLQFIAEFSDGDVYTLLSAKKIHGAPTDYGFCVKVRFAFLLFLSINLYFGVLQC